MAAEEGGSPVPVDYSSNFFKNALKAEIKTKLVNQKVIGA